MRMRVMIAAAFALAGALIAPVRGEAAGLMPALAVPAATGVMTAGYDGDDYGGGFSHAGGYDDDNGCGYSRCGRRCGFKYFWDWHGYKRRKWVCWGGGYDDDYGYGRNSGGGYGRGYGGGYGRGYGGYGRRGYDRDDRGYDGPCRGGGGCGGY